MSDASGAAPDSDVPARWTADLAALGEQIAALRRDLDTVLPHVVHALTRDEAHEALVARLDAAERRLEARAIHPLALDVARLLHDVRRFDRRGQRSAPNHLQHVEDGLSAMLRRHGFEETGAVGEPFDQQRHRVLAGRVSDDGRAVVAEVVTRGLAFGEDIVTRAEVSVRPADDMGGDR